MDRWYQEREGIPGGRQLDPLVLPKPIVIPNPNNLVALLLLRCRLPPPPPPPPIRTLELPPPDLRLHDGL